MATVDEYLNNLLIKKSNNNGYTQNEERAYSYMYDLINRWKQSFNNTYYWNNIQIEMQKSGSKAKGDAIKGKSDIDIFVSITDRNNTYSVKDYYENLYNFLKPHFINENIRKQNVSIGVTYAGCSIDITPGKRVNYNSFNFNNSYSDHNIYSRKNDSITLTNIQKHIDLVRNSGLTKEMMVLRDENIKDADIHTYINEFRSLMSRLTDGYTEKKNYRQILHDGIRLAEIPKNMLFVANHKVTINNNSIVFTWGTQGIYYRKTFTDVRKITTAEEVEQIILENLSK